MDDGATREEQERRAALAAFKERQRPPTSWVRPSVESADPVAVLVVAVLAYVVLTLMLFPLLGEEETFLAVVVSILRTIALLVAAVAGIAAAVSWGIRRGRR
jgi:protein-S-isoprenylcysteine O-methyltransferase Ste14